MTGSGGSGPAAQVDAIWVTSKASRAAARRLTTPAPPDEPDVVLVPREVADEMAAAIAAMQALAAETMLEVASSLKLAARRPRKSATPLPCPHCQVQVAVGEHHDPSCPSDEAKRLRATAIPRVIAD